jgi:hypothetical protein
MRPVAFGEALSAGTRLTLFSGGKPDHFFTVIKFWIDKTSGAALDLKTGAPTYQVEDDEGRTHLLIHLAVEEDRIAANGALTPVPGVALPGGVRSSSAAVDPTGKY